jgi:hypothetical protein
VELGSKNFVGAGTLSTLTHSSPKSIQNNIALRRLTDKQSVALCLVYLAKGYEHKFNNTTDDFILQCAETVINYDDKNLNALLLKAEYLEHNLIAQQKAINILQTQKEFQEYQTLITCLYNLGYREMPLQMKNQLIKGWSKDTITKLSNETYARSETNLRKQILSREASVSWGLFDENFTEKPAERIGNTIFNTKTKKITSFAKDQNLYNNYNFDPVVFAWNIDPLYKKYPEISPYAFCANNPIYYVDLDGRELVVFDKAQQTKILGYFKNQLGVDMYSFNKKGELRINQQVYKDSKGKFNDKQNEIATGINSIVTSSRVIEAKLYETSDVNFQRNPTITESKTEYDETTKRNKTTTTEYKLFGEGKKGFQIPNLGENEGVTFSIPGDDRAFILMNTKGASTATYDAVGGGQTSACESCVFIHELIDHGLGYINTGTVPGQEAGVDYHNKALENKESKPRTKESHGQ